VGVYNYVYFRDGAINVYRPMKIITIDFETFYDKDYTLKKMTTEAFIRDPRFEVIIVGIIVEDQPPICVEEREFREDWVPRIKWGEYAVLAHHAQFDGAILAWHYSIRPKMWLDTISMARAVVGGYTKSYSLGALSELFQLPPKGDVLLSTIGLHRGDMGVVQMADFKEYCIRDCVNTRQIFNFLMCGWRAQFISVLPGEFPHSELVLIDRVIRMFVEPTVLLDPYMLAEYRAYLKGERKAILLNVAGYIIPLGTGDIIQEVNRTNRVQLALNSNAKFADILGQWGVVAPMKISPTTGSKTYAFAKTDKEFTALLNHSKPAIRELVAARLAIKSSINETRVETLLGMSSRGAAALYYNYAGAEQTQRLSGGEKTNFQNMPRGGVIRNALCAPMGHKFVVVDSSNIEARILDTFAGEEKAIQVYRDYDAGIGPDIYCHMAGEHYGREIIKERDPIERQFGKVIKLGCGYNMGGDKFQETARQQGKVIITNEEAHAAVASYRRSHKKVVALWKKATTLLESMQRGVEVNLDAAGIVTTTTNGFILPNGMVIKYPNLHRDNEGWVYTSGRTPKIRIYGGKEIENTIQALAKIVFMDQCEALSERHPDCPWVLSSHDEGGWIVPDKKVEEVKESAAEIFTTSPSWWVDLPLNYEIGISTRYGWAK